MRRIRSTTSLGKVSTSRALSKELAMLVLVAAVGVWVVYWFAQEAYLNYRLSAQASALRQQNASRKVQETGYHRDIVASMAGGAAHEERRLTRDATSKEQDHWVAGA